MKRNYIKYGKKILALSLAAVLGAASLTTGCGQSSSTEASNASNKENSSSEAAEAGTEAAAPVLTVWSDWGISDYFKDQGDAYYWKAIEEATGVDLQFIDSSGGKDALSILVGTDDLPDIIIEYDGTLPGGVQKSLQTVLLSL